MAKQQFFQNKFIQTFDKNSNNNGGALNQMDDLSNCDIDKLSNPWIQEKSTDLKKEKRSVSITKSYSNFTKNQSHQLQNIGEGLLTNKKK